MYTLRSRGTFAEYSAVSLSNAMSFLIDSLPNREQDYYEALRFFAESVYQRLSNENVKYFLDKTPRYYLILNEIAKIFPDAKFIFLFRNPLGTLASVIQSFNAGKLGDFRHRIDLLKGPRLLAEGYEQLKNRSFPIRYEDLVVHPKETLQSICEYLNIQYEQAMAEDFLKVPQVGLGDQYGSRTYNQLEKKTLNHWKTVLSTRYRKKYALRYLKRIGRQTIEVFGYDYEDLISELENIPTKSKCSIADRYYLSKCIFFSLFEIPLFRKKLKDMVINREKTSFIHY